MSIGFDLPGVALITGAGGSGIGAAVARAFAQAGCTRMALVDINPTTLSESAAIVEKLLLCSSLTPTILQIAGDISSPEFIDSAFDRIKSTFGRLDYAVNCAGIVGNNQPSDLTSIAEFDRINGVNYRGLWLCSRAELGMMKVQNPLSGEQVVENERSQRGAIVNIASQLGIVGRPDAPVYCATKSAVIGLTRCDAIDYSSYNIRVNAVCPGIIDTPLLHSKSPDGSGQAIDISESINIAPMKRVGKPEEVADVVVFLVSEKASFVQGAAWVVDGGYTIN